MRLFRTTGPALFAAFAALALGGCTLLTGVHSTSKVTVSVSPAIIGLNQNAYASGTAYDGSTPLSGNSRYVVTFTSRNPNIASVNQANGLVTGVAYGATYIIGENRGERDSALITVRPIQAVQVIINGSRTPTYRVGAPNVIGATAYDSAGRAIGDRTVSYVSRNPAVLTISTIGAIQPVTVGTSYIVASIDNGPGNTPKTDSVLATVTVPPVVTLRITPNNENNNYPVLYTGSTLQFSATLTDSLNNVATRTVTWSVPNAGTLLSIDAATGLATGIGPSPFSTTSVAATAPVVPNSIPQQTIANSVAIYVLSPIDTIRVLNTSNAQITSFTAAPGSTTSLTLVPRGPQGNDLLFESRGARQFSLTSSNTAVFTVPATSNTSIATPVTAVAAGTATLTIQGLDVNGNAQGKRTTITVTVQ